MRLLKIKFKFKMATDRLSALLIQRQSKNKSERLTREEAEELNSIRCKLPGEQWDILEQQVRVYFSSYNVLNSRLYSGACLEADCSGSSVSPFAESRTNATIEVFCCGFVAPCTTGTVHPTAQRVGSRRRDACPSDGVPFGRGCGDGTEN